jgi:DUF1680 family protein
MNMLDSAQRAHVVDTSGSPHAHLRTLPLEAVSLADDFWEPRRRINREVTLPSQYRHLEETGCLDNFRRASGKISGEYQGIYFNDSDVYKWLEAASWTLATDPVHPHQGERQTHATRIISVPYYAWANREAGAMRVWLGNG